MLRPLISPNNTIAVYPANNTLVITDYADNLRRIGRIIAAIDLPGGGEPVCMPLRNASAVDIAPLPCNRLLRQPTPPAQRRCRAVASAWRPTRAPTA